MSGESEFGRPERSPLFLTHFSDSPRTAIGVQTAALMREVPWSRNAFFATAEHLPDSDRRVALENVVVSRVGRLQRDSAFASRARTLLGWWPREQLRPSRRGRLEALAALTNVVYVSPLAREDPARMRSIVQLIDRPFVLHLWDSLAGSTAADPDLRWLLEHADRVLVVSEPLQAEIRALGVDSTILRFTRGPARAHARAPVEGSVLRIALIGLLDPYVDGVVRLDAALGVLAERGIAVEAVFIGAASTVRRVNRVLRHPLRATGFLSAEARDDVLATCQVGFLPGPVADPADDTRSRYSIPSRSLDFLAAGLPVVGTLHPRSAAAAFYRGVGIEQTMSATSADELADLIDRLRLPEVWLPASAKAAEVFGELTASSPGVRLRAILEEVVRDHPHL